MPTPSEFNPIILFPDHLKLIHAALAASGCADLAAIIENKTVRSDSEQRYLAARPCLDDNEFDFDEVPIVSEGEHGAYVSCWVWVSREHAVAVAGDTGDQSKSAEAEAREARLRRRRLDRRLLRLKPAEKNAVLRNLATILYGADLDPETQWTQDNIEEVAECLDTVLKLRR